VLSPGLAPITNFQWTVPGNRVKDFYVSSDALHTNGWPVALTNSDLATNSVVFHWVDGSGGSLLEVQCTAQVKGETLTAKTKFNVIRPSANWNARIQDLVAVDNDHPLGATFANVLHFGGGTNYGITFTLTNVNLNGYAGSYAFSCIQLFDLTLLVVTNPAISCVFQYLMNGRDGAYPYKSFGQTNSGQAVDSPGQGLITPSWTNAWRMDAAQMFLMFQPASPSIPVPLRVDTWFWSGTAANGPPWYLASSPTNRAIIGNNLDTIQHPAWTNSLKNSLVTTTNCP
jgi:hypothetical protein